MGNWLRISSIGLAMGALVAVVGCYAPEPPPFNPRQIQELERHQASELRAPAMQPLPTTLQSPELQPTVESSGEGPSPATARAGMRAAAPASTAPGIAEEHAPVAMLSLQEIIHRAVLNSLDVKVAGYDTAIDQTRIVEAEAQFDPRLFITPQFERRDTLTGGTIISSPTPHNPLNTLTVNETVGDIFSTSAGVRQNLQSGGQIELRYESAYTNTSPAQTFTNPNWDNNLVAELTQPLLRNFGGEVNRARIVVSRNNQRVSLLDFRLALEKNIAEIERNYWQLALAQRDVKIQEDLLGMTVQTADILEKRRQQDVTRLQISQAHASIRSRQAALVRARAQVRDLSDQIKRQMNDPDFPITGVTLILPADAPSEQPITFNLDDQISTAMENRPELGQQQLRIDSASLVVRVARNNLLPQLNLVGSIGAQGLGPDFSRAVDQQSDFNHISYRVGLQLEVPLGNREARAIYQRTLLQRQQAIDQYRNLVEQVSLDVKLAVRAVDTAWREMVATRQARFAAADALLAIQQREQAGESLTPTFVQLKLQTQADLADAQRAEAQAVANYNVAIAGLERAKGTLLRYNNVLMEQAPGPNIPSTWAR